MICSRNTIGVAFKTTLFDINNQKIKKIFASRKQHDPLCSYKVNEYNTKVC